MKTTKSVEMCKSEKKAWLFWAIFLSVLMLTLGCKSTKDVSQNTEVNDYQFKLDSSIVNTKITNPVLFEFEYKIPSISSGKAECDSICKKQLDEILSSINNRFKNGENELKISYDKYNRILKLYNKIKGSKDSINYRIKVEKKYYKIKKTVTIRITTNKLTNEQTFNLWVGRIFWLLLAAFIIYKIKTR